MKRRKFLGGAALAGIPVVAVHSAAGAADFGKPASLTNGVLPTPKDGRLSIPLDESGISPSLRTITRSVMALFGNAMSDTTVAKNIADDPAMVLKQYGLENFIKKDDPLIYAAKMASDTEMHALVANADYRTFMSELRARGYLAPLRRSGLRAHYMKVLHKDQKSFTKYLKTMVAANPTSLTDAHMRSERVNRIIDLVQSDQTSGVVKRLIIGGVITDEYDDSGGDNGGGGGGGDPGGDWGGGGDPGGDWGGGGDPGGDWGGGADPGDPYAVAAVVALAYIAVVAYVYVVAASQVAVGLNVAAYVTAWTKIAVWTDGGSPAIVGESPATDSSAARTAVELNVRNLQRMSMAASIYGRKDLVIEGMRAELDKELLAMVSAAEEIGIIAFPAGSRKKVITELKKLCRESVGLGA